MPPTSLELKGLHLPDPISWWPPAIGWWLLVVGIVGLTGLLYWLVKHLTRKTAVKSAQALLLEIKQNPAWDNAQKLRELSALLRRVAISVKPRAHVASLTGAAWLAFLDAPLQDAPFSSGIGKCFADAPYRQILVSDTELSELVKLCGRWLKQCMKPIRNSSNQQKKCS